MNTELRSRFWENAWILLPIILLVFLTSYFMFPLLDGIVLGVVFAYVGRPIRKKFKRRRLGSAVATVAIILPVALIITVGTVEILTQLNWVVEHQGDILRKATIFLSEFEISTVIRDVEISPRVYEELTGSLKSVIEILARVVASIPVLAYGVSLVHMALNFVVSIFVCYFLLLDGGRAARGIIAILPNEKVEIYRKYCVKIDGILSGIFVGAIYTSLVGGIISAIVFYAFDIPKPFALASFVFIAGLVPILSSWLVIVPIAIYRYSATGPIDALFFFTVASVFIYLPSDLIIRPYLVSTKSTMHPLLVVLSFVGGALVAGVGGFFLAPALTGMVVGMYQVQKEEKEIGRAMDKTETNEGIDWG